MGLNIAAIPSCLIPEVQERKAIEKRREEHKARRGVKKGAKVYLHISDQESIVETSLLRF